MSLLREWVDRSGSANAITRPVLVQSFPLGWRAVSTAIVGGGIGPVAWWINAQVSRSYSHPDPSAHAVEIAAGLRLDVASRGVAMLTAADPSRFTVASDAGVEVVATVGLGLPVSAAAADEVTWAEAASSARVSVPMPGPMPGPVVGPVFRAGTINLLVTVPVPLSDAAMVNAVVTATEAKTQALVEAGVPGTGTSSDAVCIVCPAAGQEFGDGGSPSDLVSSDLLSSHQASNQVPTNQVASSRVPSNGVPEPYGGPRSLWGARLARAVHAAVVAGTADWVAMHPPGDEHRRWGQAWP